MSGEFERLAAAIAPCWCEFCGGKRLHPLGGNRCECILCKGKQSHPLTEPNRVYVEPGTFDGLARRVAELERIHTERLDMHVARLERLERPVDERDAIAWEIGHAAGARGDSAESNPFRKVSR